MDFIDKKITASAPRASIYSNLGSLYEKKLWHQLTEAFEAFLDDPQVSSEDLEEWYKEFVSKFEARISQLRLAIIIGRIAETLAAPVPFISAILTATRSRLGTVAATCLDIDIILATVKQGQTAEAKKALDEIHGTVFQINTTENAVYSKYHRAWFELRKIIGPPQDFYASALQFLTYTPMESLKTDFKFALATDIALAAITGDGIFNFGEVLTSPIVNALKDTPNEWLFDMLVAMNQGNIENFNRIIGIYRERYASQPALAAKQEGIKKKLVLMGLVAMVFERHPHDRTLSFADISARTQLPINQVEWVLMSALSQQLIKGSIDEVAQAVEVSWVIPRVLDIEQLKLLESQLSQWSEKAKSALVTVEERSPELYM